MLGSDVDRWRYDDPCSDQVAFMMVHKVTNWDTGYYRAQVAPLGTAVMPTIQSLNSAVPIHEPIFPAVVKVVTGAATIETSEEIKFSLAPVKEVKSAELHIRKVETTDRALQPQDLDPIINSVATLKARWVSIGGGQFDKFKGSQRDDASPYATIQHDTVFSLDPAKFTYITYKFEIIYNDGSTEANDITFALRDYHESLPDIPAPVYAQGNSLQLVDILFIPARNHAGTPLNPADLNTFRSSLPAIIRNVMFRDPTLMYYHDRFNFWVNPKEGRAFDYNACSTCCHEVPPDVVDFELKALLHQADQRDFTDNCTGAFSAEMNPDITAFLHELGHMGFYLMDEYPGRNGQHPNSFPNNWFTLQEARDDATFRHKVRNDARLITY
jgi:hypothetical protein